MYRDPKLFFYSVLTLMGLVLIVDWLAPVPKAGAECRAGYVYDGDTITILCEGKSERARLLGFDTPELTSPQCAEEKQAAEAARQALISAISGASKIEIERRGRDKYQRALIHLRLDGTDVAARMIAEGHARAYDGRKRQGWCNEGAQGK